MRNAEQSGIDLQYNQSLWARTIRRGANTVKQLIVMSISAMLAQLSGSTESPELLSKIETLKDMADKYGLGDLALKL